MAATTAWTVSNLTADTTYCNALNKSFGPYEEFAVTAAQATAVSASTSSSVFSVTSVVTTPVPVVTNITGSPTHTAGGAITITGSGFTGATGVEVGAAAATSVVVVSDTSITATAPAQAAVGNYGVVVTTPAGSNYAAVLDYAT